MRFSDYSFGSARVDGVTFHHDLITGRQENPQAQQERLPQIPRRIRAHPLPAAEHIPWHRHRLVIGTGADGALPVMKEVHQQAGRHDAHPVILPTAQAIGMLTKTTQDTNAILHLTC